MNPVHNKYYLVPKSYMRTHLLESQVLFSRHLTLLVLSYNSIFLFYANKLYRREPKSHLIMTNCILKLHKYSLDIFQTLSTMAVI